jgi:hypothetical protein
MQENEQKQRRSNLMVGWAIGILVVILYVTSILYGVGGK